MMNDRDALDILRAEGHAVGTPDVHTGRVTVWYRGGDDPIDVEIGRELHELAEGKLSFDDIRARRDEEAAAWLE
jgi:hypothetical protein